MQQDGKKTNSAFLDKFKGRTSKVDKTGLTHALLSEKTLNEQMDREIIAQDRPRKLSSLDSRSLSKNLGKKDVQLDELLIGSPDRRKLLPALSKRGTNLSILAEKDPLPLLYTPMVAQKETKPHLPPSRSTSEKS